MQQVLCPTCGAPVPFRSAASVMAVCDWCKSTLIKDADTVRDIGRMSDVIEDYSPIQINTSGSIDAKSFLVVGRIQLKYDAGFWNEWYVLDDAGQGAWLSDASGQYTFTREVDPAALGGVTLPAFEALAPGTPLDLGRAPDGSRARFIAGDVRSARCTGGQGELPFAVGAGYETHVADFRRGGEFVTLDYTNDQAGVPVASTDGARAALQSVERIVAAPGQGVPADYASRTERPAVPAAPPARVPVVYRGRAVALDALRPQLLRDPSTITDTAGRVKGKVTNLACPSCGAAITIVPGATTHLLCPTCHAAVDTAGPVAEVLDAARRVDAVRTTLPLGATGTIAAVQYTIIGVMRRAEISDEADEWTEYLLYAPQKGFVWLVETDEGWERADVLDDWPFWTSGEGAVLGGVQYKVLYDYRAVVRYAAGAFNWRVAVGDVNEITEFQSGNAKLAAEANDHELTWSRSTPVAPRDIALWFGKSADAAALAKAPTIEPRGYQRAAKWLIFLLIALNFIPVLSGSTMPLATSLFAALGIWFPAYLLDRKMP